MSTRKITRWAILIALYVGLTFAFSFLSYEGIQFRIAEALVLLVFFKRDYAVPLILACAIANIPSPLGLLDVGIGTLGTFLAVLGILAASLLRGKFKRPWIPLFLASLAPVLANGFLVAWELGVALDLPFWPSVASVAFGEFTVVSVFGVALFGTLSQNKTFLRVVASDEPIKSIED